MRFCCALLVSLALAGCSGDDSGQPAAAKWTTGEWQRACTFDQSALPELSGLTASRRHPGILWALNDGGNAPTLIAIDEQSCEIRGKATIPQANTDWEGLAAGARNGEPVLFIGDIGDNTRRRTEVAVIEVPEPALGTTTPPAKRHPFSYPDGPVDAEAIMAADTTVWVVTKQLSGTIYRIGLGQGSAKEVGSAPSFATDAAISPVDKIFAIRDYPSISLYRGVPPGDRLGRSTPPQQPQAEAVTFSADGKWLYTASEQDARLLRAPVKTG